MRHPDEVKRTHDLLDAQLGRDPSFTHWGDGWEAARREAKALLADPAYAGVLAAMREAATPRPEPEPMLGLFQGTGAEHAVFRLGAAALWQMLVRMAEEADQHEPV